MGNATPSLRVEHHQHLKALPNSSQSTTEPFFKSHIRALNFERSGDTTVNHDLRRLVAIFWSRWELGSFKKKRHLRSRNSVIIDETFHNFMDGDFCTRMENQDSDLSSRNSVGFQNTDECSANMVMHFDQSWRVVASPLLQETNCYENNRSR
jgi:hypothetical protein